MRTSIGPTSHRLFVLISTQKLATLVCAALAFGCAGCSGDDATVPDQVLVGIAELSDVHGTAQSIYGSLFGPLMRDDTEVVTSSDVHALFADTDCADVTSDETTAIVTFAEDCLYSGRIWHGAIEYAFQADAIAVTGSPTIAGNDAELNFRLDAPHASDDDSDGPRATIELNVDGYIDSYVGEFEMVATSMTLVDDSLDGLAATGSAEWTDKYGGVWQLVTTDLFTSPDRGLPRSGTFVIELLRELRLDGEYTTVRKAQTLVDATYSGNDVLYRFQIDAL